MLLDVDQTANEGALPRSAMPPYDEAFDLKVYRVKVLEDALEPDLVGLEGALVLAVGGLTVRLSFGCSVRT